MPESVPPEPLLSASDLAILPEAPFPGNLTRVATGEWAGWHAWGSVDPFEDMAGPFHVARDAQGLVCGWRPGPHARNSYGSIHGGALMTFADFSLFMLSADGDGHIDGVTVTMNSEFLSAARAGELLLARGGGTGGGHNIIFARGLIIADHRPVLHFSGVIKRARTR